MKKAVYSGLIMGGLLLAGGTQADTTELSYSYIEAGLTVLDLDIDGFDQEAGFNIRSSFSVSENIYLLGTWDRWEVLGTDFDSFKLGLGYRFSIAEATDAFIEGSYIRAEAGGFIDDDEDGGRLDAGLRHSFGENAEGRIFGGISATDDDETFLTGAEVLLKFPMDFGLNIGYETAEFDDHIFRANLRYSF